MFKKLTSGILFLTILLVPPLILIPASNGYAGGPEPPGEGMPAGGKLITGHLVVGLATDPNNIADPPVGDAVSLFIGTCGKTNVVIGPFFEEVTLSNFSNQTTEEYLDGITMPGVGPAGCFSVEGGETVIVTKIKKFIRAINYYYNADENIWVIESPYSGMGAELTIDQYIEVQP